MNWELPVCSFRKASGWAGRSVCMLRMTHSSSACVATSGNSSETHRPLWPCWRNFHGEPSSFAPGDPARPVRGLAVVGRELRLVVERVDVRGRPVHAEEDHALGAGREVRGLRRERRALRVGRGGQRRQAGEGQVAEPRGDALQQVATRECWADSSGRSSLDGYGTIDQSR